MSEEEKGQEKEPRTKLTLWVPEAVVEAAKIRSVKKKQSLSEAVTDFLREWSARECAPAR